MKTTLSLLKNRTKNFHVDVKGLVFNEAGKLMLLKEPQGSWDLPGGRMEHGETFASSLLRECQEEMGVTGKLLDQQPVFVWPIHWKDRGIHLVYLAFRLELDSFDFKTTNECVGYDFFTAQEMDQVNLIKAIHPLKEWLRKKNSF